TRPRPGGSRPGSTDDNDSSLILLGEKYGWNGERPTGRDPWARVRFHLPGAAGWIGIWPTSVSRFAWMFTLVPSRPPGPQPTASCHETRLNVPAGACLSSNLPSASVTAKYGWSKTRTQPLIHGWMLQAIFTGNRSATRLLISCLELAGMRTLPPAFLSGCPCQLKLWATGAGFLATSTCPCLIPSACGSNLQQGWSMTTSLSLNCCKSGCIGSCWPAAGASHTNVQRTPLLSLLTTHSSLRIGPLARQ